MSAHLLFEGGWAECENRRCKLAFHLDMTAHAASAMPQELLYPLLEAIDPPKLVRNGWKLWNNPIGYAHRDYGLPSQIHVSGEMDWHQHGRRERFGDLPAHILADGSRFWYLNGFMDRADDLPSAILADGTQEWYRGGEQDRDGDKPAVIRPDGYLAWYHSGRLHRDDDQPAVITTNGTCEWYRGGLRHRVNGPAVIWPDGMEEYWTYGEPVSDSAKVHSQAREATR